MHKTVYAIIMIDGTTSYVGCTKNVKAREYQHRAYNKSVSHLEILESVNSTNAKSREQFWIKKKIDEGCPLKNRENKNRSEKWNHGDGTNIRVNPDLKNRLEQHQKKCGASATWIVTEALTDYLDALEEREASAILTPDKSEARWARKDKYQK
jgi:predicted GIY-YIG superfamily endonuclease